MRRFARFLISDWTIASAIFVLSVIGAIAFLNYEMKVKGSRYLTDPGLFDRSVVIASGRGPIYPDRFKIPALQEFLDQKSPSFNPADLPAEIPQSMDTIELYHRYMVYAIALTWKIFGISWDSMKYFMALLFGITVTVGYGLFRLGMNRLISLVATTCFAFSPAMLIMVSCIRDFAKAPFVLGAILVMGLLATKQWKIKGYWGLAALLGLIAGVGMGFRQDALICFFPAPVIILFFTQAETRFTIRQRVMAIFLLSAAFFITAFPMLTRMSGGAQPYHPLVQGFCTECRDNIGLASSDYEQVDLYTDNYVFATTSSYYIREYGEPQQPIYYNSGPTMVGGKKWLIRTGLNFPADLITRTYAAVLWAVGDAGAQTRPLMPTSHAILDPSYKIATKFAAQMERHRIFYLTLTLGLIAFVNARLAWILLLFLLYFCGYVSLEFQYRHAFHLCLVPLWITGFLLSSALRALLFPTSREGRNKITEWIKNIREKKFSKLRGLTIFTLGSLLLIFAPLHLARAYQYFTVNHLVNKYEKASIEPLEMVKEPLGDWTLFHLKDHDSKLFGYRDLPITLISYSISTFLPSFSPLGAEAISLSPICNPAKLSAILNKQQLWDADTAYLTAEFKERPKNRLVSINYKSPITNTDFTHIITIPPSADGLDQTERYFFPIYEVVIPAHEIGQAMARNKFIGIAVPSEDADDFKGLYRVTDPSDFREWPSLRLPSNKSLFRHFQSIATPTNRIHRFARGDMAFGWCDRANEAYNLKDYKLATDLYRAYLTMRPEDATARQRMALSMEQTGDFTAAINAYALTFNQNADNQSMGYNFDRFLARATPEKRIETWIKLAENNPKSSIARHFLGIARMDAGDLDGAVEAFHKATELAPDQSIDFESLGSALIKKQDFAGSIAPLRRALELNPKTNYLRMILINSIIATGDFGAAEEEVRKCQEKGISVQPEILESLRKSKAAKG